MTLKQPIEVRSMKTGRFLVSAALVSDVPTADFYKPATSIRVVNKVAKAMIVKADGIDIRDINRALREPHMPEPEDTSVDAHGSTR